MHPPVLICAPPPSCWFIFPSCLPLLAMCPSCPGKVSPFLSIIPYVNASVCWWNGILISGIVGIVIDGIVCIVFCMFLLPPVLLICPFHIFVNASLCLMSYWCVPTSDFPSVDRSIDRSIVQLIGEYQCMGFEIETTCPCHHRFMSIYRHPRLRW